MDDITNKAAANSEPGSNSALDAAIKKERFERWNGNLRGHGVLVAPTAVAIQPQLNSCQEKKTRGSYFLPANGNKPEWPQHVKRLREEVLGDSQSKFANELGVTVTTVSSWETGAKEPSAPHYVKMGKMAPISLRLWFWAQVGIDESSIVQTADEIRSTTERRTGDAGSERRGARDRRQNKEERGVA